MYSTLSEQARHRPYGSVGGAPFCLAIHTVFLHGAHDGYTADEQRAKRGKGVFGPGMAKTPVSFNKTGAFKW
jgi:hypothetical protein